MCQDGHKQVGGLPGTTAGPGHQGGPNSTKRGKKGWKENTAGKALALHPSRPGLNTQYHIWFPSTVRNRNNKMILKKMVF